MAQKKKKSRKRAKKNRGSVILLKAILYVLAVAVVFGLVSWGLERLDERKKDSDKTPTQSVTKPTGSGGKQTGKATPTDGGKQKITETPAVKEPTKAPTKGPTDTPTPTPTEAPKKFTAAKAEEFLKSKSASKLKLSKSMSDYDFETDEYTTNINGVECFGVIVLNKGGGLAGEYFVALDGSVIFRRREDDTMESIQP